MGLSTPLIAAATELARKQGEVRVEAYPHVTKQVSDVTEFLRI